MDVILITIGDEILIGRTVDTNSAWMAAELNVLGLTVREILSVADEGPAIVEAVERSLDRAELVLLTGGLGPTRDDITKKTLADFFGMALVEHQGVLQEVERLLKKWGRPLNLLNRSVALMPEGADILLNRRGTAPAMWFERNNRVLVSMPGVPHEMRHLMTEQVLPALQKRFELPPIQHRHLLTAGIGESQIAEKVADLEEALPPHIKLAYLPSLGQVKLRLTGKGADAQALGTELQGWLDQFRARIADYVHGLDNSSLEEGVLERLAARRWQLGIAESCTGGKIGARLTRVPGSSAWFRGGVTAYSYEAKSSLLGVNPETLAHYGAVSEQTVQEMLTGALRVFDADIAAAVSGIAGPDGGTEDKPVGTVYIGVATRDGFSHVKRVQFPGDRAANMEWSTVAALNMLRRLMDGALG
ncbi:MAG: competence/damage-inducible protein A [Bacteroidetes bacterium]|nr:competence/damage-inducible protein A [Bacteroidota bacterium]